ncbi:lysophospholipid transporter LplT [Caldalkalibacillus mannanilyticus]|uniref:lysophospholipid transporter LplT n=1 Tax=Caldalkalibacillus mannanilyticus TaxID=1418 RepID=UPI00046A9AE5|nr:lysophospholipid transporter LplT [Caldalkalibacillus mannanilyticus]
MKTLFKPLQALYFTQFLSAFADNMILFITLAIITQQALGDFYIGIVQASFFVAYIALAPFVGPLADKNAKSRILLIGNIIKASGILLLLMNVDPALSYAVVGIGAVIYSPAKYGILPELTKNEDDLLVANGKVEGYTILAILTGTVAGGVLANQSIPLAMMVCFILYVLSTVLTLAIPKMKGRNELLYRNALPDFMHDVKELFTIPKAQFSIIGTASFWMTSAVLRLAMFAWIPLVLGITMIDKISMIVASTGFGIVLGSLATPYLIPAKRYYRSYLYGFFMVAIIFLFVGVSNLYLTIALLLIIGFMGGVYIVPMNSALQEVGHQQMGAGKAIAVQNFANNILMLLGVGAYTMMTKLGFSVHFSMLGIGTLLLFFVLFLMMKQKTLKAA